MREECLYVYGFRPDRPEGTIYSDGLLLDRMSTPDHGGPSVRLKSSGEKVLSIPMDRSVPLEHLRQGGRIDYEVVCVGPWKRKQLVKARLRILFHDDFHDVADGDSVQQDLTGAFESGLAGAALREFLEKETADFSARPRSAAARLVYWCLWGRLGLAGSDDPVLEREQRLHPKGIDAIKEEGRRRGLSPNYLPLLPEDVREDILKRLQGFKCIVHTDAEPEYDYLEDEFDFVVEVVNPNPGGQSLDLEFSGEFTIFFGASHAHYAPDVGGYEREFLSDVRSILDGMTSAVSAWAGEDWLASSTVPALKLSPSMDWNSALATLGRLPREFKDKLDQGEGLVKVENWNPDKSFQVACSTRKGNRSP